jgi:hypothetical protein
MGGTNFSRWIVTDVQTTLSQEQASQRMDAKYSQLAAVLGDLVESRPPGFVRIYQGGMIVDTGAVAYAVYGAIYQKYVALGREKGFLGNPLSDETGTADGAGRFSRFANGVIYWTPATGAHEVHGAILAYWSSLGAERSFLGYPITDELSLPDGSGRYSNFQKGQVAWSPVLGAAVSSTSFNPQSNGGLHPLGLNPAGVPVVRRRAVIDAHIAVTDDETFGSDEHAHGDKRGEVILTSELPQELISMAQGAGGEVRIELRLDAQATLDGDVIVTGKIQLYEGTSEQTDDLDGEESVNFVAPRDNFTRKSYTVRNQDEGGDHAEITMTVSNFAV